MRQQGRARPRVNHGRIAAARALLAIDDEPDLFLGDALDRHAPRRDDDRALSRHLAFGVLRCRSELDACIAFTAKRSVADLEPAVRTVLRLGAFERRGARTKPHAVVHQAVELAKALRAGRASGLVNAVLRRLAAPQDMPDHASAGHPAWLWNRWQERYGTDKAAEWCASNNHAPPIFIVAKAANAARLPQGCRTIDECPGVFLTGAEARGPVVEWPGFREGDWWVQDLSAVRVADLLDAKPGQRVLDACAAPGGKTLRLASQGAVVSAVDRSSMRLEKVVSALQRTGLSAQTVVHDWLQGPCRSLETFDAVLVDAPCSGLGTVGRHPEIRWRRHATDLGGAGERQERILSSAAAHVDPGGVLVYAVCSPEPEEGPDVVARFVSHHPEFVVEATMEGLPTDGAADAHFAVRLRKQKR